MKFSIKTFFSKYDPICSFLRIWSQLLKKSLTFLSSDDNVMHGIINNQLKKILYFKNTAVEGT